MQDRNGEKETEKENVSEVADIPYSEVEPLPIVTRGSTLPAETKGVYRNKAPLQDNEKGIILIKEALKNPINVTIEDFLHISEVARQGLKKWLTKKRVENVTISLLEESTDNVIHAEDLPWEPYEVLGQERSEVPAGSLVIGDPVVQYLRSLKQGEKPKKIVVAQESQGLRAVYLIINDIKEFKSLLDGGSQIVSMAKYTAIELKIVWDPKITVHMESANRILEETLGLAKNVPFYFGHITIYLQIHIMEKPAYQFLLGRPFDSITESLVKNDKNGNQTLTLTDPNSGAKCTIDTHKRSTHSSLLKTSVKLTLQNASSKTAMSQIEPLKTPSVNAIPMKNNRIILGTLVFSSGV